jgi:hypothetical protein
MTFINFYFEIDISAIISLSKFISQNIKIIE